MRSTCRVVRRGAVRSASSSSCSASASSRACSSGLTAGGSGQAGRRRGGAGSLPESVTRVGQPPRRARPRRRRAPGRGPPRDRPRRRARRPSAGRDARPACRRAAPAHRARRPAPRPTPSTSGASPAGLGEDHGAGAGRAERDLARGNGQAEDRAHVQGELAQGLRRHRHHAGVVRARGHLAEQHLVAADEQLDAEDPGPAEPVRHGGRDRLRALARDRAHRLRLPALAVVAVDLHVPDRRAERRAAGVAHGEQGDLVVEVDEALDDHAARARAAAGLRVLPRDPGVGRRADDGLALAARGHDRLDHAGHPELGDGRLELAEVSQKR